MPKKLGRKHASRKSRKSRKSCKSQRAGSRRRSKDRYGAYSDNNKAQKQSRLRKRDLSCVSRKKSRQNSRQKNIEYNANMRV